jgi:hypothetical protein
MAKQGKNLKFVYLYYFIFKKCVNVTLRKNYSLVSKLSPVLRLVPQIVNTLTPVYQTIKTFEKSSIWQNISILPLSRVIFQLKNNKN